MIYAKLNEQKLEPKIIDSYKNKKMNEVGFECKDCKNKS